MQGEIDDFVRELEASHNGRKRTVSPHTVYAYRGDLEQFQKFLEQHGFRSWQVSALDIVNYRRDLEARYAKATTRARKLAAVKAFYRYLVSTGRVDRDPARNLDAPVPIKRAPETLSPDQLNLLVESARHSDDGGGFEPAKAQRNYAMLSLLCTTGLLASELVALDLMNRLPDGALELGAPHRRRTVALDGPTGAALATYLRDARPVLAGPHSEEPALFLNHRGRRLTRQGFWLIVKQCAERAGIDGISPRLLRHSCAAHKLTGGARLKEVQELLGHAHPSTTQAYVRSRPVEAFG